MNLIEYWIKTVKRSGWETLRRLTERKKRMRDIKGRNKTFRNKVTRGEKYLTKHYLVSRM